MPSRGLESSVRGKSGSAAMDGRAGRPMSDATMRGDGFMADEAAGLGSPGSRIDKTWGDGEAKRSLAR
jgi:hypothetical protein